MTSRVNPFDALYKSGAIAAAMGEALPHPLVLDVELTNHCNLECVMCARRVMTRNKGHLALNTHDMLLQDAKRAGVKGFRYILWGEPLLNPNVIQMIADTKTVGMLIHLTTNGVLLPKLPLETFDSLDSLIVSFQGTTVQGYEEMRGKHLAEVSANLRRFLAIRGKREKPYIQVSTTILDESIESQNAFQAYWLQQVADRVSIWHTDLRQVRDLVPAKLYNRMSLPQGYSSCVDPYYKLNVLHDGTCVACCGDPNGILKVGKFPEQSLSDIWKSESYNSFRQKSLPNYPLCKICSTRF